jgi:hypothetical protein
MNMAAMSNGELDALALTTDARQGEAVLGAVYKFLARFVAYPSEHARIAHALWILHTHLMNRWESTPRLAFLSPEPASGKTRALEVTELLVPDPASAVNVSPAYLFRKVGSSSGRAPTILFDEIDTVFGPKAKENEEIRGLLNAGHRRGAVAGRCVVRGKTVLTEELPAYAAVALAGLGWLPDTLLSRSIVIRMRRRHAGERIEPFRRRLHAPKGWRLRGQVEAWASTVPAEIEWPAMPPEITDRPADVWESLLAVADLVGGDWPARARVAAVALVAADTETEPSLGVRLLSDLRTVFGGRDQMPTTAILADLIAMPEAPWGDLRGKPLDDRGIARRLRAYGIKSTTLRVGDTTPKGYKREDLADAWERYLPPQADTSATSATSATMGSNGAASVADSVADVAFASATSATPDAYGDAHGDTNVAAVADVALPREAQGGERVCAQCRAGDGELTPTRNGGSLVFLHQECAKFWQQVAAAK